MAKAKVVVRKPEWQQFIEAVGYGALNFAHAVEADAKREAPVRGGYRSFLTTKRTKAGKAGAPIGEDNGSVLIGGTLRRSIHSAGWINGKQIGTSSDENGKAIPDYAAESGKIVVVIGTNCDYGAYVELGTVRMVERPFLGPAFDSNVARFESLVRAGMKAKGF